MYTKNDDLYFNENDCFYIENLKFRRDFVGGFRTINNSNDKTYIIGTYLVFNSIISSYEMYIDPHQFELLSEEDHYNKITLLNNFKNIVELIYNTLLYHKKRKNNIWLSDSLEIYMSFINEKPFNKTITQNNNIYLYVGYKNYVKFNDIVFVINRYNIRFTHRISIKNNAIYTFYNAALYMKAFNTNLDIVSSYPIKLSKQQDNFIEKLCDLYYIDYFTPPKLLIGFINNIKLFDEININRFEINNEYDLLKYL